MKKFTFVLAFMMSLLTLNVACTDREGAVGDGIEREETIGEGEEAMEDVGEGFEEAGEDVEDTLD